jgi:NADP-dependent alcohol dehydrogenase
MLNFELYNPTNLVFGKDKKIIDVSTTRSKNPLAYGGGAFSKMEFTSRLYIIKGHEIVVIFRN